MRRVIAKNRAAKTAEAIGFRRLATHRGDVFDIDSDGYLRVVDRKKGADHRGRKNMSPANIENNFILAAPHGQ